MKIPYFCCIGAELKRYEKDFDFMNQVYLYKVPTDDSIEEVLSEDYFKPISDSVLQDDLVYIYEASSETLHSCRFDKQNGHITAVPLASDETLTGAVTTIIHDNLTPGKLVVSDSDGKIAASETDADELAILHGLEATTEELNYSHGVTANIQDQLDSTVHKAGTETITGDKTFTKPISFSMSLTQPVDVISITDTDLHSFISLSCDYASSGMFTDFISHNYASNYDADLRLFNGDAGSFYLELTGSGNATNLSLSMSETSTSSTVIPTMGWANNPGLNNIVHKTGNESISGNKTFAGTTTFNGATALSSGTISVAPTNNNDITNKNYVDTIASGKANVDMDNLTDTGKNIANWSSNVSNCITNIPQDIKLELNNGTLTLKAGSKVYVPNGVGVFDLITTTQDCVMSGAIGATNNKVFIAYKDNAITSRSVSSSVSGAGATTSNGFAFDTTANKINFYNASGVLQSTDWSFPVAIVSTNSSGVASSIDQVFNGFGYIGSTVFALPGVKWLGTNGRNTDGTLKSIVCSNSNVMLRTFGSSANTDLAILFLEDNIRITDAGSLIDWKYYEKENYWSVNNLTSVSKFCALGYISISGGKILLFNPKTAFHAVNYSDTEFIVHQTMPDYTAGVSRSINVNYTELKNGYLVITPSLQSGNSELNIEIAGQNFQFWQGFDGVDYNHLNIGVFPIPRNVTYIITRWQNVNVKFFPCIGG